MAEVATSRYEDPHGNRLYTHGELQIALEKQRQDAIHNLVDRLRRSASGDRCPIPKGTKCPWCLEYTKRD